MYIIIFFQGVEIKLLKDYLEKNNIEVKSENEYHYISFDTEFENISIKYDDEVLDLGQYLRHIFVETVMPS